MSSEREYYKKQLVNSLNWILYPRRTWKKYGPSGARSLLVGVVVWLALIVLFNVNLWPFHTFTDWGAMWRVLALVVGLPAILWLVVLFYLAVRFVVSGFIDDE